MNNEITVHLLNNVYQKQKNSDNKSGRDTEQ